MFKKTILIAVVAGAFLAPLAAQETLEAAAPAPAASNPALEEVLERVPAILDSTWKSTFHVQTFKGEEQNMVLSAAVQYQDMKHFRVDFEMTVEDEFEGEKKMTFTVLADGTFLYIDSPNMAEVSQGMASGPVKAELGVVEKMLSSQMGGGMNPEAGAMDKNALKTMVKEALADFNFKEEGSGDGLRRFTITSDEANGFISFEKEHWFLHALEMSFKESKVLISTSDNAVVESFPGGTFTFTVAEGKTVMDFTQMMQMAMPPEEADDDDLEF